MIIILLTGIFCTPIIPVTGFVSTETQISFRHAPDNSLDLLASDSASENTIINTWVFAPKLFFFPVMEQPRGNSAFVSDQPDILTHFNLADEYGSTAFLAHSHLAGSHFKDMQVGDFIYLIHKIRKYESYQVVSIREFQALSPNSEYSSFLDLENEEEYSASELFLEIYGEGDRLIFQTCLEREGVESWGRMFVIAHPLQKGDVGQE